MSSYVWYLLTFLKVSLKVLDIGTSDRILQKFYKLMYYIFQFSVEEWKETPKFIFFSDYLEGSSLYIGDGDGDRQLLCSEMISTLSVCPFPGLRETLEGFLVLSWLISLTLLDIDSTGLLCNLSLLWCQL